MACGDQDPTTGMLKSTGTFGDPKGCSIPECCTECRKQQCTWQQDEDDGSWDTACGNKFCIEEGTPEENEMRFCCYCGAVLVTPNVEFSGGAPLHGAASAGTPGSAAAGPKKGD